MFGLHYYNGDWHFGDHSGAWRRSWTLRLFARRINRWWFKDFVNRLSHNYGHVAEASIDTGIGGSCYCGTGSTSTARVYVFGFGFMLWCHRDRGPQPCVCRLAVMEVLPEQHVEEIEDLGGLGGVKRAIEDRQAWMERATGADRRRRKREDRR